MIGHVSFSSGGSVIATCPVPTGGYRYYYSSAACLGTRMREYVDPT